MVGNSLYEYHYAGNEGNEPRLVGVDNMGVPRSVSEGHLIGDCGVYLGSFPEGDAYNAISASGETVFFTVAACGGSEPPVNEVYARSDGEKAIAISSPVHPLAQGSGAGLDECDASCEAAERKPGVFEGASEDGSKVFFVTSQPLLNGDNDTESDLYEAEIKGTGVNARIGRLVQVSHDPNAGQTADVLEVPRVSEDGSRVYFYAEGALSGANREGRTPVAGQRNLYVHSRECPSGEAVCASPAESTSFVATVPDGASEQATPDGRFLIFTSAADLTPDEEGQVEAGQVFEYDARTEKLVRVSRGQEGYNEDGNSEVYRATIPTQDFGTDGPLQRFRNLVVSADGARVFFTSQDALTPQALSGAMNVYEYRGGQVGLISDGHDIVSTLGLPAVELTGTDESGDDVFFTTADRLVPQDTDNQVDVYDARIEGGFASAVQAPCVGDSCQDAASGVPSLLAPATSSVAGEATAPGSKREAKAKARPTKSKVKSRKARRRAKKRTRRGSKRATGRRK